MKKNYPPLELRGFYYKIQKVKSEKLFNKYSSSMECFFLLRFLEPRRRN